MIRTLLLSGCICGLVGLILVAGVNHTLTTTLAGGRGFTAVMVSWMSHFNPFTMILTSFLLVFLNRGASEIATSFSLNTSFSDILTGIIIFFIIGCEFFIRYSISFRSSLVPLARFSQRNPETSTLGFPVSCMSAGSAASSVHSSMNSPLRHPVSSAISLLC